MFVLISACPQSATSRLHVTTPTQENSGHCLLKKKKKNYTKAASFLQRKLQQSLLSELVSTHTEAQTQLAASWEERQADTICVEKGLGHGGREASEK